MLNAIDVNVHDKKCFAHLQEMSFSKVASFCQSRAVYNEERRLLETGEFTPKMGFPVF